jgi:hypothetical protein
VGYVPQSASATGAHIPYLVTEPVESTVSQIEGYLMTSMLVSSQGELVYASDDCTIDLYADPATLGKGGINNLYFPIAKWAVSSTDPSFQSTECRSSGLVIDSTDIAYFLDGDNKAIHAVQVSLSSLSYLWSVGASSWRARAIPLASFFSDLRYPALTPPSYTVDPVKILARPPSPIKAYLSTISIFDINVGMLAIPKNPTKNIGSMIYVPLRGSELGSDGLAITVGTDPTFPNYKVRGYAASMQSRL